MTATRSCPCCVLATSAPPFDEPLPSRWVPRAIRKNSNSPRSQPSGGRRGSRDRPRLDRPHHYASTVAAELIGLDPGSEVGLSLVGAAGPEFAELARATGDLYPIEITISRRARIVHLEASTPVNQQLFHALASSRLALSIDDRTPLLTTDARSRGHVKGTVLALLEHVLAAATNQALVSQ